MTGILNLSDLVALEVVCRAAQTCARVKWLTDDGDIVSGTARHLVRSADDIGFITGEDDVRECVLRITTSSGWEVFLPMRDLMAKVKVGEFVID